MQDQLLVEQRCLAHSKRRTAVKAHEGYEHDRIGATAHFDTRDRIASLWFRNPNNFDVWIYRIATKFEGKEYGNGLRQRNSSTLDLSQLANFQITPGRATYPKGKSPGRDDREIATSEQETKKPLESQGNQGFSLIGPAGFEPTTSTTPR